MVQEIALLTTVHLGPGRHARRPADHDGLGDPLPDLAHLYGVPPWTAGGLPAPPRGRTGLLQRGALLASSLEQTNPFHRGAFVRRSCCAIRSRRRTRALAAGFARPAAAPERHHARALRRQGGRQPAVSGLPRSFSDIGYVLEAYDALGRYRETELVLDEENGDVLNELPIDTSRSRSDRAATPNPSPVRPS